MSSALRDDQAPHVSAQVAASVLSEGRAAREAERELRLSEATEACNRAKEQYEIVRDYIFNPNTPGPRGSHLTRHGEIAESLNVADLNATEILKGATSIAERTGGQFAADLNVAGTLYQLKYGKNTYLSLREIIHHLEEKGRDNPALFVIPLEQRGHLDELRDSGSIEGISQGDVDAIHRQLDRIERLSGRNPQEIISAGPATYDQSQLARVGDTIIERRREVELKSDEQKEQIRADHEPSVQDAVHAAGLAGVAGAGVGITQAIVGKLRNGKNPFKGEFTAEDWAQVGVSGGKGGVRGTIAGSALYVLTNTTNLAAPFAGSLVSAMMGINSLRRGHRAGKIDDDEFVDYCQIVASEAAIVGLATAAGQVMIPIPLLGAFLGSIAGKIVGGVLKDSLEREAAKLAASFVEYERWAMAQLDNACREVMERLDQHFMELGELEKLAFDPDTNIELRLRTSAILARRVNVANELVVDSPDELDAFMRE